MKFAHDPVGAAEGRAMLDQLPGLYFSILKQTQIEQTGTAIRCSFDLPLVGKCTKTAPTAREAIRAMLLELTDALTQIPAAQWPADWEGSTTSHALEATIKDDRPDRFQAKVRQFTIGVTMPMALKVSLQGIAEEQKTSFAEIARQLASFGFEDYDLRSFTEGSDELLAEFSTDLGKWQPSNAEQVMVRLDPDLAVRMRSTAKEKRRSASEFAALCLSHGLVLQTQLVELERQVTQVRGAALRTLAPQLGLGPYVALLSSVLAGTVRAPKKVLARLGDLFGATELVLAEFFKQSFERRAIPAFKVEKGKPRVAHSVTSWEDAVKSMNLPLDEARQLLLLDE